MIYLAAEKGSFVLWKQLSLPYHPRVEFWFYGAQFGTEPLIMGHNNTTVMANDTRIGWIEISIFDSA